MSDANHQQQETVRLAEDNTFAGLVSVEGEKSVHLAEYREAFRGVSSPVETKREIARQIISIIIVSSLLFIVVASFILLGIMSARPGSDLTVKDLREILEIIMAPVVGIVGAVTGFYFGSASMVQSRGSTSGDNR